MKIQAGEGRSRKQIYLNLVEERQRLRAINEDELTERGDVASPRDSV